MKLKYLGTAAAEGWPALFCKCEACTLARKRGGKNIRTRSQAILDDTLLLDFCPDTYYHMVQYGLDLPEIRHCLITHSHEDHFYYEELQLRGPVFSSTLDGKPLTIYGNGAVVHKLESYRLHQGGGVCLTGDVAWRQVNAGEPFDVAGYTVIPTPANHAHEEKSLNYIIEKDGKTLFYGHDTGRLQEEAWQLLEQHHYDMVSLDCTMLVSGISGSHMDLEDCVRVRERLLEKGCADEHTVFCINHFSHNGAKDPNGKVYLHEELEPLLREKGFLVSYDGMTIEF